VTAVVAGHRGRLGRVNTELVEAALSGHVRWPVVVDDGEVDDDLVRGMVEVLTWFCARLYGRRPVRDRALKAIGCAQRDIRPRRLSVVAGRMRVMLTPEWLENHKQEIEDVFAAVLDQVVRPAAEGGRHILTSRDVDGQELSTAIRAGRGPDAADDVEHPHVLGLIAARIARGTPLPLVLRTFHADEVSHQSPSGGAIPVKTLRGWYFDGTSLLPLDEQAIFAAHCTDHATGDPIPPERGVRYAGSWPAPSIRPVPAR